MSPKVYYQSERVTLYCGDGLEIMPTLGKVDLVFCSPPYEAARTYGIDFALRGQDWVDWAVPRFRAGLSICNGLVAWVIEGQTRQFRYTASPMLFMADLHRAGVHLRKPPAYRRVGIPGSGGPDWLRNDYEFVVCGTNGGKLAWSDNTAAGHTPKYAPGGAPSHRLASGRRCNLVHTKTMANVEKKQQGYIAPAKANPGNVIDCHGGGGHMGSDLAHENEAPFPEKLAEFFIKSFCPPGGTVLDCFSGSGTTVATAIRLGRKGIGIDIRESQCELSKRRVESIPQPQARSTEAHEQS